MEVFIAGYIVTIDIVVGNKYDIVFTCETNRQSVYLNGTLLKTVESSAYEFSLYHIGYLTDHLLQFFVGDVLVHRHFNYAMSADEVKALYNNGDPAEYVLPGGMKYRGLSYESDFSKDVDGWKGNSAETTVSHIDGGLSVTGTSTEYQMNRNNQVTPSIAARYNVHIEFVEPTPTDATILFVAYSGGTGASKLISTGTTSVDLITPINSSLYRFSYLYFRGVTPGTVFKIKSISVKFAGCIAEYVPQNIIISRKRDFPQVTLPIVGYTQSSGVFLVNSASATTQVMNAPQANGFSGKHMRFDAITGISLYCAYWYTYLKKRLPIKITFEYRANRTIYASQQSTAPTAPDAVAIDANDGDAQIASVIYGVGGYAYIFSAADTEAWLEMRVLAIEVVEDVCLGWLDSAKQLPLNDKYLPPLLGPIVIGDATPVNITGNNSYTWTGVDDPVYSRNITTSRRPTLGQWYRIVGSISGYKKGYPYISADTGYTEVALPRTDGPFSVLIQCKSTAPSSYYFSYRAENRGTARTLTITVDSIEPVVERGYDLAVNKMPKIIYKSEKAAR